MVAEELDLLLAKTETNLINHFNAKLAQFELSVTSKVSADIKAAIDSHVEEAFPPGPLRDHQRSHQSQIDAVENRKKISLDVQIWAIRGVIGFVLFLVAVGAKEWLLREIAK